MTEHPETAEQPETPAGDTAAKPVHAAAARALAEAESRRLEYEAREAELAAKRELAGRGGPDPVRYGDWEKNGLTSDF